VDVDERRLELLVDFKEFDRRREGWRAPAPRVSTGVLGVYSEMVGSASGGAVVSPENIDREGGSER